MDEVSRHRELVGFIAGRTGLGPEKVQVILYAGEPWLEQERFSAALVRAFQYAVQTGTHPAIPLDAILSLLRLGDGGGRQGGGGTPDRAARLKAKIGRVSGICQENPDIVQGVVEAMLEYYSACIDRGRRSRPQEPQS